MASGRHKNAEKEQLFRAIYEEFYAPLCLYANRFIKDMSISEDIVADIFASLWDRFSEMELRSETARAYLHSAVRNRCLNHLKHKLCELGYSEQSGHRDPVYATAPDTIYTSEELHDLLHQALERLPEQYRTVFVRSVLEGRTHEQIAEEMQICVKSVTRYKQRVIEQLRRDLSPYLTLMALFGGEYFSDL